MWGHREDQLKVASSKGLNVTSKVLLTWSRPTVIARMVSLNVTLLAYPVTGVVRRSCISMCCNMLLIVFGFTRETTPFLSLCLARGGE